MVVAMLGSQESILARAKPALEPGSSETQTRAQQTSSALVSQTSAKRHYDLGATHYPCLRVFKCVRACACAWSIVVAFLLWEFLELMQNWGHKTIVTPEHCRMGDPIRGAEGPGNWVPPLFGRLCSAAASLAMAHAGHLYSVSTSRHSTCPGGSAVRSGNFALHTPNQHGTCAERPRNVAACCSSAYEPPPD